MVKRNEFWVRSRNTCADPRPRWKHCCRTITFEQTGFPNHLKVASKDTARWI